MELKIGAKAQGRVLVGEAFNERFETVDVSEVVAIGETRKTMFGDQVHVTWRKIANDYDDNSGVSVGETFTSWYSI